MTNVSFKRIFGLALPMMLSNLSTPLVGLVDTGVVGQLPDSIHIGAVALGALVFTFLFWGFGFLRMGTTGLTAQALGADNLEEVQNQLFRALLTAIVVGLVLIACELPLRALAFSLLSGSMEVEHLADDYVRYRIWSAPATLMNYALLGWFIGLARTKVALVLQLVLNLTNMALDAALVLGLGWGVVGVAVGTVCAEWLAALVGVGFALRALKTLSGNGRTNFSWERVLHGASLLHLFGVNRDIMIRSLALVFVFVWFTSQGARLGNDVLAANSVLMQFVSFGAFFLDGIAFATEALVGRAVGARDPQLLRRICVKSTQAAVVLAALLSLGVLLTNSAAIDLITTDSSTRALAKHYSAWATFAPIAGVWAFQLDGIFIGATRGPDMRNGMLLALAIFFGAWWLLRPLGNHGLWAALYVHYLARTATLLLRYLDLERAAIPQGSLGA